VGFPEGVFFVTGFFAADVFFLVVLALAIFMSPFSLGVCNLMDDDSDNYRELYLLMLDRVQYNCLGRSD
jgi:hypothetical protein